ncbi:hypothetical protein [Nocardioides donggukensis]|uniref:Uncharacterized protein n=1 Tax=Nocardioides donggukensis TaxID=2774019 RepID=A0A927K4N8_9ACTN|nr:hypothetical protein [Nocardioides donggukensis]MBD8870657.1 hypothetical protein [Nocardioides donggukensis]
MSDEVEDRLGPKPEPYTVTPQRLPGGTDSLEDDKYGAAPEVPAVPDLNPADNPAVEDHAPEEISEPEDKQQEPDDEDAEDQQPGATGEDDEVEPPV